MSKPMITDPSAATELFIYKVGAWGLAAALAALVVMSMMPPKNMKEMFVGLVSTVIGSVSIGSAVIQYYNLQALMDDMLGLMSVLGLVFVCGLPAWFLVRAWFVFAVNNEDKDIKQIIEEIKRSSRGEGKDD